MKKSLRIIIKFVCFLLVICCGISNLNIVHAGEPPAFIEENDGGHSMQNGAYITFSYQLIRQNVDEIKGTAQYKLGEYFTISGNGSQALILSDYVYLTNKNNNRKYIGVFDKHNGWQNPGTYTRDKWLYVDLATGSNKISMAGGEGAVEGSGDAQIIVNLDKIGHDPVVHGVKGTWTAGEVSSGKRTWQSLWTDGATGSAEGNKAATSTGFFFSDEDEQKERVPAYVDVPISKNGSITEMKKQNSDGTWTSMTPTTEWNQMDEVGTYWIKACTKDQAGYTACGTRYVNVQSKKYEVKYNGNGSTSGTMSNSTHTYDVSKNLTANSYTKTGYHFDEWNTNADGTGTAYTNGQTVKNLTSTNGATVNLFAQWLPNTYSIQYHTNGGSGTMSNSSHTYDTAKKLSTNAFTRSGWKFIGWNTKADGSGLTYSNNQTVKNLTSTNNATIHLYAQWDQAPSITTVNKTFYQNEITKEQWLNELRMDEIVANDKEDGDLTSQIKIISDPVILNRVGTYTVVYQVTDSVQQTVNKSAIVTICYNNPPEIEAENRIYRLGEINQDDWKSKLRIQDVNASDVEDGDITSQIKIKLDEVDTSKAGTYRVIYEVTDAFGKKVEKLISVEIRYDNKPIITADNLIFHENEYTDKEVLELLKTNATANDVEDGNLTDEIEIIKNNIDPTAPGLYEVVYQVVDSEGAITTKTIDVNVMENDAPILQLFAPSKRFIENEYSQEEWENELRMLGVTAHDHEDHDLTSKIQVISDTTKPSTRGIYEVTYQVSDRFGKTTTKKAKVTVEPNEAPIIYANDKYFKTSDVITERDLLEHVYASDDYDGDLTKQIQITHNTIKIGQAGIYEVTYEATDRFGKVGTKIINVHVEQSGSTPSQPSNPPLPSDPNALGIWNGRQLAKVQLTKLMEFSEMGFNPNAYKNVVFGVYAAEDIVYKGNVVLKANSLVGLSNLDDDGNINAMIYHSGKYYIQELSTDDKYLLSSEKYYFEFE